MRSATVATLVAAILVSGATGFAGARALAAAQQKSHFEADSAELDRTEVFLRGQLATAVSTLKSIAKETTPENAEASKAEREKAIGEALKPLQEDAYVLLLEAHMLALDSLVDKGGDPVEQFVVAGFLGKLGVDPVEAQKRRTDTGMGYGGVIMGYLIAKAGGMAPDEIFKSKGERSWAEVMRSRNIPLSKLMPLLEGQ